MISPVPEDARPIAKWVNVADPLVHVAKVTAELFDTVVGAVPLTPHAPLVLATPIRA
jgi:hypothetical protein